MILLPKLRTKTGDNIGVELFISHPDLETDSTFIVTDVASGVTTFTVENGLKFSNANYLVVGNFGSEKAEIVKITGTPTATSISLTAVTKHPHNRGEKLQFIPYNQIILEYSTDGTTYGALTTLDIRADSTETYYNHTAGLSTYYYRARFSNATSAGISSDSDELIATGYAENSAGAIIRDALISTGEKMDDEVFTKEFLLRALDEGRDEIDMHEQAGRWSFRTEFDFDAGDCIPGRNTLTLPTNLRDLETSKHILSVRIGKDKLPLDWSDKIEMNTWYQGVAHSTLNGAILAGATSILLTSSGDFDESGAVDISAESITETLDNVDYSTNTESTKTLGTVTNVAVNHASGRDVWQGASFGVPTAYTVDNGVMTFNQPFDDDTAGENIYLDYYKKKEVANSFGDTLDENFYRIYLPYMRYRLKLRKNPSMNIQTDPDYIAWVQKREAQISKEFGGQNLRINVDVPC
ncbi:MAG: hypothetical protein WC724_03775 [Candidatus Paceibacterota bacterium]|jgi:hypothetical protein